VLDVSGHTVGHLAFVIPGYAFTADSLMAGGCGRLFEGSPALMWQSLMKLAALPGETLICSGHEYTTANLRFAATIEPDNPALSARIDKVAKARAEGRATVPSRLSGELATNPFLRARLPHIKALIGLPDASDAEAFAEIRARKDKF
jgi:hydroxyacylglutathione hydrolase